MAAKARGGERLTALAHQLLRDPQPAVRAHDAEARDVPVRHPVGRLLLHLGEHVAHDLGVVVRAAPRAARVHRHEAQLRPRQRVVQVVLEEVVLGQVLQVGVLDQRQVRAREQPDVHGLLVLAWA